MYCAHDRSLDLNRLLDALLSEQHLAASAVVAALDSARLKPANHPLETIASLALSDLHAPGQQLDMDWLCRWLANKVGQPYVHLDPLQLDLSHTSHLISPAFAERHGILPIRMQANAITVASAQPYQHEWEADLNSLGYSIHRVFSSPVLIRQLSQASSQLAQRVAGARQQHGADIEHLQHLLEPSRRQQESSAEDAHIISLVDWILQYAVEQRASDIHLEPQREQGQLRYRIDGLLHPVYHFPSSVMLALTSRLKHLARMNVAERRRAQDGRVHQRLADGSEVELRASSLPTPFGEKLVLRLFDAQQLQQGFAPLGLQGALLDGWLNLLQRRQGIILVTGPTGSGKTQTLYASLEQLACPQVNLCTIEDPIERLQPHFSQLQVNPMLDLDFAGGVRALLRQDPDVIMIGEIRDQQTAQVAIQAALTGHLVLSTLHTNDACSAITRLQELGVADYLIKATLVGVMAQRLVRTLCKHCRPSPGVETSTCPTCRNTGYHGRTGLFELLLLSDGIRQQIDAGADVQRLRQQAVGEGLRELRHCGEEKVAQGLTSLQEVMRVCG
ncbi:GspE/PulE family protein [Pseudomonas cremoricolorata]|uniref:Type II secretion system protein E n=1 Tax=Pseudomonas cremoricolorata TaxID=157783 RepID=A0A089WR98_9PSED|nr:GspE/PulE family protein [Pseudomonas cremoricolorata]AIR89027.1 type II secretion system protein E [Pseudomonas cremoricolorata]